MNKIHRVDTPTLYPGRRKLKFLMVAALLLSMSSTLPSASHAQTETILGSYGGAPHSTTYTVLDTLGTATPRTKFSVFGSGGIAVFSEQFVGPRFTLTRRSVLTRVGAFINNCRAISNGVPQCPEARPLVVQIRRSVNGVPDPNLLIAAAPLSHDNDPLTVSFESASFDDIPLEPGTYYALFAPQQAVDSAVLIGTATGYVSGTAPIGIVSPNGSSLDQTNYVAVQILARPVKKRVHAKSGE